MISGKYQIYFSVNNINYYPIANVFYQYYNEIIIHSVTPNIGFFDNQTLITLDADNIINDKYLFCKARNLLIAAEVILIEGKAYAQCLIPAYIVVKPDIPNPTFSDYKIQISLSNNKQQFSNEVDFEYLYSDSPILTNFLYFPKYGPETGNSIITFKADNFLAGIDPFVYPVIPNCT